MNDMLPIVIKLALILIVLDGIGSLALPSRLQAHNWWLDAGRITRAGIGAFLLITFW